MIENFMPKVISIDKIIDALAFKPAYEESIREADVTERLIGLEDIYKVYIPSTMSKEIYLRFYSAVRMALHKKDSAIVAQQQRYNYQGMLRGEYRGIIGGADSFTIIGESGIGKSSAIERAIELITNGKYIENANPYYKIIPCVVAQCPFDCSAKGMLLEILRIVDSTIGTTYYQGSRRSHATTDVLIGSVSQVCINHIGLLIIDEIQNVTTHKGGMALVNMLTQLINNSGISICMVGTPECVPFFEQSLRMARRSLGLKYDAFGYDDYFQNFCRQLFELQYVQKKTEVTNAVVEWLYAHSKGILSIVVSLIHDAQEIAIFTGTEILDISSLNEAYLKRMGLLKHYTKPQKLLFRKPKQKSLSLENTELDSAVAYESIAYIVQQAKNKGVDIVSELRQNIKVEEVNV